MNFTHIILWKLDEERERSIRNMPIFMRESGVNDGIAGFWEKASMAGLIVMEALRDRKWRKIFKNANSYSF